MARLLQRLTVLLSALLCARRAAAAPGDERFIGWSGETYRPINPLERGANGAGTRW